MLLRFDDAPDGPQLRLLTMALAPAGGVPRRWGPLRVVLPIRSVQPTQLAVGPHLDVPASDYAFVLADNVVRIISLGSGCQVRVLSPLGADALAPTAPPLSALAVAANGCCLAVGCAEPAPGPRASGFWLYDLALPERASAERAKLIGLRAGSAKYGLALPEQRIREGAFFLGTDRAGGLNEHAHVHDFMRVIALSLIHI